MSDLDLAVIGNCSYGALIDRLGRVVWACLPRFDADPVFCSLLNGPREETRRGFFDVVLDDLSHAEQEYLPNTAIVVTRLYDSHGSALEITDLAPRYKHYERVFRPTTLARRIRPLMGSPRIRIRLRPAYDYGAGAPQVTHGSNHIRYVGPEMIWRVTTDAPVSFVLKERPFLLEKPVTMLLGADEPLRESIDDTYRKFFDRTHGYWRDWTRYLSIPFEWQDAVIRAAITLKLCSFEETGAIIAAMTTSVPEAPGTTRTWDYRYCWLRDAYFVVQALNRLGATKTMEDYLNFITNVVAGAEDGHLQPLYGVTLERRIEERIIDSLAGYRGMGPVRVGNQAYEQVQNDVYGGVILAAAQAFFDQRLTHPSGLRLFERLEIVGRKAARLYDKPDAGLWELRTKARVHTFSAVMCWAGCDRLARIAERLDMSARTAYWRAQAERMHKTIIDRAWDETRKTFVASFDGTELDASLLLLNELGFVAADDPRYIGTVEAINGELRRGDHMLRYAIADDFGMPENAFVICTFWLINALAAVGRKDEARALFENMLKSRNSLGLLSEDIDFKTGELWGNFPQTYSMVGLINAAMTLSKPWNQAF